MVRFARVVVQGIPHHVTQRGNRRLDTFFGEDDYRTYLKLLAEHCPAAGVTEALRRHGRTGRPLGSADFLSALEARHVRPLKPGKPGPKPKAEFQGQGIPWTVYLSLDIFEEPAVSMPAWRGLPEWWFRGSPIT